MNITINLEPIITFLSLPLDAMLWKVFWTVGWMPVAITFIWGSSQVWLNYIRSKWFKKFKFVVLAIDIPRGNQQSPKAVENIFTYLAGAHGTFNLHEKWWLGEFQLSMSLEIVSMGGYIQFLIRAPEHWRNLVESAIYSQYPDAEITEVNDYVDEAPSNFPDDEYDIWGSEIIQQRNSAYPIKTYRDFEHNFGAPEVQFKDPMSSLMDLMSSLKKGEQLWYQIILIPIGFDWMGIGDDEVKRVLGDKVEPKKNIVDKAGDGILKMIGDFSEFVYKLWGDIEEKKKDEEPFRMMNLTPKQKVQIEAIQDKVNRLGFMFKVRFIYLAKKEVMNKPKAAGGFVGFIKQFALNDLNSFKPDVGAQGTATKINYPIFYDYRLNWRKNNIMRGYKDRDDTLGRTPGILNIEELATIWHFPVESVAKAPLIQKAPGRKAEAPASLPVSKPDVLGELPFAEEPKKNKSGEIFAEEIGSIEEDGGSTNGEEVEDKKIEAVKTKGTPPANLPFV